MRLFSDMNREELRREIERLEREMRQARRNGLVSELEILRQRINLAKSYLTDPERIRPGLSYEVEGSDKPFFVEYLRGVMAWGHWEGETESVALPIGILKPVEPSD
ncbi:DUF1811 family protein [Planifilum fimeticola]|jgi:hypothetical protein